MLGKTWRLKRYRRLRDRLALVSADSNETPNELITLWRCIKPHDLIPVPTEYRAHTVVAVKFPNLPELVRGFTEHNRRIADEADYGIERAVTELAKTTHNVVFDLYLADQDHYPIDEHHLLTRLRGQLQEHQYLVAQHPSQYYQRLSELYYHDIVTLTDHLLDAQLRTLK